MDSKKAYLMGLMCARGHIYTKDYRIIIEFAHKNKFIEGIAHCPKCGDMATIKKENNPEGFLFCKSCGIKVDKSVKKSYEQKKSTISSITNNIIPFLDDLCETEIVGNDHMTFLVLNFDKSQDYFDKLVSNFKGATNFDSFIIPDEIYKSNKDCKIEFINGFMDSAGFFNAGGWLNRNGKNGSGRMRAYLQIVRNWKMPVLICNFLKKELYLPIHTIDWGHPNIRDSGMKDYYESNPLSWSREHQVKFFPEYYNIINLRIEHKKQMFQELLRHNKNAEFDKKEDCDPPNPITTKTIKPYHFGEKDSRIPEEVRGHFDAFWQVCHNLECIYSKECISNSKNPSILFVLGKESDESFLNIEHRLKKKRQQLTEKIVEKYKLKKEKEKTKQKKRKPKDNPEQKLYEPICKWFEKYLSNKFNEEIKTHDTSSFYLDRFIMQNDLFEQFDFCTQLKIKPDIVGFHISSKNISFVEVKVGELTLKDLGQLLGYCMVANPKIALLVSPKKPSINLIKILNVHPDLLKYNENKRIILGTWKKNQCNFLEY